MLPRMMSEECLKDRLGDISGELRDERDLDSLLTSRGIKQIRQANSPACETANATERKEIQLGEAREGQGWE